MSGPGPSREGRATAALVAAAVAVAGAAAACGGDDLVEVTLSVDLVVERCPLVVAWAASPLQVSAPDGTIDVAVTATAGVDIDAGVYPLTYAWTATAGSFSGGASPRAVYRCLSAGAQILTASVVDRHRRVPCADVVAMAVTCKGRTP